MSGSTSVAVPAGGGGGISAYRPPFTAVQWQELEHQALIYKYLVAGVPVPYDLVVPIRRSLEALSARFFHNPTSVGYCSYYGKKFDPEPGRCRRTDGKKWRCSKDAYPDSKYCERHMHRGRNRSRKPVESQSASQSLSTAVSHVTTVSSTSSGNGSFQSVSNGSFQYSTPSSGSIDFGSNVSKLRMDTASPYGINNNFRYGQGLTVDVDDQAYSSGASASADTSTWRLMPTTPLMKSRNAFDPMIDPTAITKASQQHCLFGSKIGSPVEAKQMRPFFDEWPEAKEQTWSTTQLSMSTAPQYSAPNDSTPNGN